MTAIIELDESIDDLDFEMPEGLINQVPLEDGAKKILAEFRVPRSGKLKRPYILFAKNGYRSHNERTTRVWSPFMLPLDGCFCTPASVEYYVRKGFTIIKYWIPPENEREKYRDPKVGYSDRGADVDHFAEVEEYLTHLSNTSPEEMGKMRRENDKLQAEILELRGEKHDGRKRAKNKSGEGDGPIS